jgi:hypothetical protein
MINETAAAGIADMEDSDSLLYVVLEPPADLARWTNECRRKWERVWRPDIPPALGGMGPLSAPLDPRTCVAKLEQLCALQPVVFTRFLEPRRFPEHQLVYLPPTAEHELDAFAGRLAAAGFSMRDNPFGHVHHFAVAFSSPSPTSVCGWPFPPVRPPQASTALNSSSYTSFLPHQYAAYGADAVRR